MDSHEIPLAVLEELQDLLPVRLGLSPDAAALALWWSLIAGLCVPPRGRSPALTPRACSSRIVARCAWLNIRLLLREVFFVNAAESALNAIDLMPRGFAL